MPQALYRKWRPHSWDDVVGQEHVVTTLRHAVAAGRMAHAYLFAGPRGTGKTTTARLLAKAANCTHEDLSQRPCDTCEPCKLVNAGRYLDLIEIDAASNTSVDDVRDLRDKINFSPNTGRFKVYIVDEVHMLSTAAFNALLKTLEEPPPHAMFILATTEAHKIPATVSSRCQRHEFRRIKVAEIAAQLRRIIKEEDIEADEEALLLISRQATGSLRDAISLLDQLASTGSKISFDLAQDVLGTATSEVVVEMVAAIRRDDAGAGLDLIHRALDSGADPRQLARQVVDYLRGLLVLRMGSKVQLDLPQDVRQRMAEQAVDFEVAMLLQLIQAFNTAAVEQRNSWQPGLALEIALVQSVTLGDPAAEAASPHASMVGAAGARGQAREQPRASDERKAPAAELKRAAKADADANANANASSPARSSGELDQIRAEWRSVRDEVRKLNSSTGGLLNSCSLLELRGSELFLGFASETVKALMEKDNHIEIAQKGIEKALGRKFKIRCVIASDASEIPDDLTSDGMVATSLRLGGKIVHSRDVAKKPTKNQ